VREVGARQHEGFQETPAAAAAKLPAATAAARRSSPPKRSRKQHRSERESDDVKTCALRREDAPSVVVRLRGGRGELLVRRGVLSREHLFLALGDHYQSGGRIGDAVVRLGFAARNTVETVAAEYVAAVNRSHIAA